ncbi:metallopeptidase family protein [Paracoccus methylarcula]|uniref:Neutral zinc metallopeptidase n=1 Tax=Paracoccus methylarcula TaxID=72022 RepID=A0A422QYQ6_9RHOB|nr:metallopeptidase family protein [Paracoccus methylarcula]RNF35101.1 neutral zinc metallopeptidase [Paracoccus methylarcula]
MSDWDGMRAPDAAAIEALAREAVAGLPARFAGHAQDVAIRVAEFASEEMLDELQIDDGFELTGLYEGIPLTEKSVSDQPGGPDIVWLFRRPILDEWAARGNVTLGELIAHVVTHELAHHFGWSDEDIARIDRWWE